MSELDPHSRYRLPVGEGEQPDAALLAAASMASRVICGLGLVTLIAAAIVIVFVR